MAKKSSSFPQSEQLLLGLSAEVEVVEQYSDPRDSKNKAYVEPGAETSLPTIYSKVNRNYCRPYTDNITCASPACSKIQEPKTDTCNRGFRDVKVGWIERLDVKS
ncbi:hypothetical protein K0M31_013007 [Melipona bicolor]|uniref:Uncharacterized protein n=1 Tax=Melipona bicolor TaxID=60889 RepID=A0AA40KGV2_9HYME|nr:hypothetical protein K0M31_013007 [Melipona bicolor]